MSGGAAAAGGEGVSGPAAAADADGGDERVKLVLEFDPYYSDAGIYLSLTSAPIPQLGERGELEIYGWLLSRALLPRYAVVEASVNPMPCLGLLLRKQTPGFYRDAQLSSETNLVRSITTGFEEPWAASLFLGNVVDFDIRGRTDATGKGYSGFLLSAGNYHIKDNALVDDRWWELEWKVKGDRRSSVKKLSWSFRVGTKIHDHPEITDTLYLHVRRDRLDYTEGGNPLVANAGAEYRYDMSLDGLSPLRHTFLIEKKWLSKRAGVAFSLGLGVRWESRRSYTGALATAGERFQFLIRPNVEF